MSNKKSTKELTIEDLEAEIDGDITGKYQI
jgi:hypothetical protein